MNGRMVLRATLAIGILVVAPLAAPFAARLSAQQPVQVTPQGILIDFQDADIRLVMAGLAEAGGLNLLYGDLPARRVTLQMRQPVARDAILPLIRNLARSNGLRVTEEGGFFRLDVADAVTTRGAAGSDSGGQEPRLFTYRLRHARANRLSATLQSVFGGAGGGGAPVGLRQTSLSEGLRDGRRAGEQFGSNATPATTAPSGPASLPGRLQGEVQIVADEGTNALLIRALPSDDPVIEAAIVDLDRRPSQVLIEVLIAEVRHSTGLEVSVSGKVGEDATPDATGTLLGGASTSNGALLLQVMRGGTTDQRLLMSLLASRGDVRVVSRPVLLAQNNLEARIMVGSQRPFKQLQRTLPTETGVRDQIISYRDVGTKLTLRPTINDDGYVNLEVVQEVSQATGEQFDAPIISTREAATHLFLRDGQTGVIGGLVSREEETTRTGIPILMDIPILGWLFGSSKQTSVSNELFIFLTPHVLNDDGDLDRVRRSIEQNGEMIRTLLPEVPVLIVPDSTATRPTP